MDDIQRDVLKATYVVCRWLPSEVHKGLGAGRVVMREQRTYALSVVHGCL